MWVSWTIFRGDQNHFLGFLSFILSIATNALRLSPLKDPLQLSFINKNGNRPAVRAGMGILAGIKVFYERFHLAAVHLIAGFYGTSTG
jgi:hypothetical protein